MFFDIWETTLEVITVRFCDKNCTDFLHLFKLRIKPMNNNNWTICYLVNDENNRLNTYVLIFVLEKKRVLVKLIS